MNSQSLATKAKLKALGFSLSLAFYPNNRIAIVVTKNNEPFGKLSVNLPDQLIEPNQFFAKTYSENESWADSILALDYYFSYEHQSVITQYVECCLYSLTPAFIAEQFEATYCNRSDIYEAHPALWALYEKYCKKL